MRREDWSVPACIAEAAGILIELLYVVLQILYGVLYEVRPGKWCLNIVMSLLVYVALTLLEIYPEKINRIPEGLCKGKVRTLSIAMVRTVKLVFAAGLTVPSAADAFGVELLDAYSLIVMGAMFIIAVCFEIKIYRLLKNDKS